MRCPSCKSMVTSHDTVPGAETKTYKCPNCSSHIVTNLDWKMFIILGFIAAPVFDGVLQFALQTLAGDFLVSTFGSKEGSNVISLIGTTIVGIALYAYLRRPKIIVSNGDE